MSLGDLVSHIRSKYPEIDEVSLAEEVFFLWKNGKLELVDQTQFRSILDYLRSINSVWFHTLVVLVIVTIASFIFNLTFLRIVTSTLFLLFLPGYLLLEYLYPSGNLHSLEKIALSIGLSIVITSLLGLLMNFTPAGILSIETIMLIAAFNLVLGVMTLLKKYNISQRVKGER